MRVFKQNKSLEVKDITTKFKFYSISIWLLIIILISLALSSFTQEIKFISLPVQVLHDTIYQPEDIELTDSAITAELVHQKCMLPNVALAQMKIETGNFKSAICKENKNIAGIRTSKSKYVTGMNRGHCTYRTYKDCIKDYVRVQERYLKNIDGCYAQSTNYINTLKKVK